MPFIVDRNLPQTSGPRRVLILYGFHGHRPPDTAALDALATRLAALPELQVEVATASAAGAAWAATKSDAPYTIRRIRRWDDLWDAIAAASLLCLPERSDDLPLPVITAWWDGLTTLTLPSPAIRAADPRHGRHEECADIDAMVDRVRALLAEGVSAGGAGAPAQLEEFRQDAVLMLALTAGR
jgi:hypothetical protein